MKQWITDYVAAQKRALDSIPAEAVTRLIDTLRRAHQEERQVFVFGNGGSAANSSHFATDLGKGSSDKLGKRFRVLSLTDNVSWMTAIGNDYSYDDIFVRQLENYGRAGDVAIGVSVSGNSPNCVKALDWAGQHGLHTIALVGAKRAALALPDVQKRFADIGLDIAPRELQSPEGMAAFHKAETEKWWPIIKAANIKVE